MKTLLLMRHAKSSWDDTGLADHDRPLNKRGVESAGKMGRLIAARDLTPNLIISSSSKRTRETIKFFLEECTFSGEVIYTRELYHGGPEDIIESLHQWGGDLACVLVVGHNPAMELTVEDFTGENEPMTTAAIAQIEFDLEDWGGLNDESEGRLKNFWRPKDVD